MSLPVRCFGRAIVPTVSLLMPLGALHAATPPQPPESATLAHIPALTGIVLLGDHKQFDPRGVGTTPPGGVDATRVSAIPAADARRVIGPLLGKPLDGAGLLAIRKALQDYFIAIHRPFVSVIVPAQVVDSGVAQVIVLVSRLEHVGVTGNRWFDSGQYTGALHVRPGEPIDGALLDSDLDWINRNPYRHATVVAKPGEDVSTTDLEIRTDERFPASITGGVSNTGTQSTSLYRINTGIDWGNALWRGDDLNFNVTMSPDAYLLRQFALAYTAELPWRDTLTVSGDIATSHSSSGAVVGNAGLNSGASLRYQMNLAAPAWLKQHLTAGYDFKSTNNNLLFGGASVFNTTSEVDQFILGYGGVATDASGRTSIDVNLFLSPGGLTPNNTTATFNAQQPGATASYVYVHLAAERVTRLPDGFSWDVRGVAQFSNAILLPSEQMIFGGYASVRGFAEQGAIRDNGVLLENELRLPSIGSLWPKGTSAVRFTDQLTPFVFIDYGVGWNHRDTTAASSWLALGSVGPGLTWQIQRYLSARFTWGIPLTRHGDVGPLLAPQFGLQLTL